MEPIGTISEGEWSCLSGMYTSEEADFMAQLLGNCPMIGPSGSSSSIGASSGFYWPSNDPGRGIELVPNEGPFYDSHEMVGAKLFHFSQGSSSSYSGDSGNLFQPSCDQDSYYIADKPCPIMVTTDHGPMSMEFYVGDASNAGSYLVEGDESSIQENVEETNGDHHQDLAELNSQVTNDFESDHHHLQPEPELRVPVEEPPVLVGDKGNSNVNAIPPRTPKKRSRSTSSGDNARRDKSNGRGSSKSQRLASSSSNTNEEDHQNINAGLSRPASSSNCSDDYDSNGSHDEHNGTGETSSLCSKETQALNLSGKTRAGRGAATDPQSLYARKRRERINERLKVLQSLVPNGTKVDISTMLEEAVQYVKFLQLQIKLLSSDDMWMYAPIAYNGMDIGLDLKVPNLR